MEAVTTIERNIFLFKELDEENTEEIIKNIIKINNFDAEQKKRVLGYKVIPIKLHLCTPRRITTLGFCNM